MKSNFTVLILVAISTSVVGCAAKKYLIHAPTCYDSKIDGVLICPAQSVREID